MEKKEEEVQEEQKKEEKDEKKEESDVDFKAGDMVWAKLEKFPFWPAQVFDLHYCINKQVHAMKQPDHILVRFEDKSFAWIPKNRLHPFRGEKHDEHHKILFKKNKARAEKAYQTQLEIEKKMLSGGTLQSLLIEEAGGNPNEVMEGELEEPSSQTETPKRKRLKKGKSEREDAGSDGPQKKRKVDSTSEEDGGVKADAGEQKEKEKEVKEGKKKGKLKKKEKSEKREKKEKEGSTKSSKPKSVDSSKHGSLNVSRNGATQFTLRSITPTKASEFTVGTIIKLPAAQKQYEIIKQCIIEAKKTGKIEDLRGCLETLRRLKPNAQLLKSTLVGKEVRKLKKNNDPFVRALAEEITEDYRTLIHSVGQEQAADSARQNNGGPASSSANNGETQSKTTETQKSESESAASVPASASSENNVVSKANQASPQPTESGVSSQSTDTTGTLAKSQDQTSSKQSIDEEPKQTATESQPAASTDPMEIS